jgi:hypothetical protein
VLLLWQDRPCKAQLQKVQSRCCCSPAAASTGAFASKQTSNQLQEPRPAGYNVASASLQRQLKEMQPQLDRLKAEDHVQLPYGGNGKMYSTQAVLRVTVQRARRIGCGMTEIWWIYSSCGQEQEPSFQSYGLTCQQCGRCRG